MSSPDGRRSLMGFYAEAHGIPIDELDVCVPMALYILHKRQLAHMIHTDDLNHIDDSPLATELMTLESQEDIDDSTRDRLIMFLFAAVGVEVKFQ